MTSSGFEPATFRFVTVPQPLCHGVPHIHGYILIVYVRDVCKEENRTGTTVTSGQLDEEYATDVSGFAVAANFHLG
jgi:hypothetical protein